MSLSNEEVWGKLISEYADLSNPVNVITGKQIKAYGKEPRLMAKYDAEAARPQIFKDEGLFLLPKDNESYYLLNENGYCALSFSGSSSPSEFEARFPIHFETLEDASGEMNNLDKLYLAGMLQDFVGTADIWATIRGRRRSQGIDYNVGPLANIVSNKIQFEVDQGYESAQEIVLVEAKTTTAKSFLIRQLYFPYRVYSKLCRKPIRCVFYNYDETKKIHTFIEYAFTEREQYKSINEVRRKHYVLVLPEPEIKFSFSRVFKTAQKNPLPSGEWYLPQANDIGKVISFPLQVAQGYDDAEVIASVFDFDVRQSNYYREACQEIGLAQYDAEGRYALTSEGTEYVQGTSEKRSEYLITQIASLPIFRAIIEAALASKQKAITKNLIVPIGVQRSRYNQTTVERRTSTILAWLRWAEKTLGEIRIDDTVLKVEGGLPSEN